MIKFLANIFVHFTEFYSKGFLEVFILKMEQTISNIVKRNRCTKVTRNSKKEFERSVIKKALSRCPVPDP